MKNMNKNKSNGKMIFSHLCDQMKKLSNQEISTEEAKSHANLAKQANNLMKYELDRAIAKAKFGEDINIREIED